MTSTQWPQIAASVIRSSRPGSARRPRSSRARWRGLRRAANLAAARQFHAREGRLQPARKHIETVDEVEHKIDMFLDNARRRADRLSEERRTELDALGMRW
ncbi:Helicase associated domain protein [Streptomyces malaysiensis subsp. malaysiensis]